MKYNKNIQNYGIKCFRRECLKTSKNRGYGNISHAILKEGKGKERIRKGKERKGKEKEGKGKGRERKRKGKERKGKKVYIYCLHYI